MNKQTAKELAEKVTEEDLAQMFENAKNSINDWEQVSAVNKSITKGTAWNILLRGFKSARRPLGSLVKTNMIREFGDYLPGLKAPSKNKKTKSKPAIHHEEPIFD